MAELQHNMSIDDTVLTNNNDDTYAVTKCPFTIILRRETS